MTNLRCKLTDALGRTRPGFPNECQWGPGVTHVATGKGRKLCTDAFIHYYEHPLIAVLFNPIHGNYYSPRLWEITVGGTVVRDATKCGARAVTTVRQIDLPAITTAQRVRTAIVVAREDCDDTGWLLWADRWLSGEDRSVDSAGVAREEVTRAAALATALAEAAALATALAEAARVAAAWEEVHASARAAWAVESALSMPRETPIDLVSIIQRAMEDEPC